MRLEVVGSLLQGRCLAVVTARRGSKGVPGKNVMPILGKPAIYYTLRLAKTIKEIDKVVVSTDCPAVAEAAGDEGVRVIERPPELSTDEAHIAGALRHAVRGLAAEHEEFDLVVLLYANVPYRKPPIVAEAIRKMRTGRWDAVLSLCPVGNFHPLWVYRLEGEEVKPYQDTVIYRRQDLPQVYAHTGAAVVLSRKVLLESEGAVDPNALLGHRVGFVLHHRWDALEIDEPEEACMAEALLRAYSNNPVVRAEQEEGRRHV